MNGAARGLESLLADGLAELANRSLDLDPAARARLEALEGRSVQICPDLPAPLPQRELTLCVSGGRVRFYPHAVEQPNVIVRGAAPDLAAALLGGNPANVTIDGDTTVLQELGAALAAFRPAADGPLGRLLGAELARDALGTVELAFAALLSLVQGAGRSIGEEAGRAFVTRPELARFLDQLDDLALRVDRLKARVGAREQAGSEP